jgi:hypothetical protein
MPDWRFFTALPTAFETVPIWHWTCGDGVRSRGYPDLPQCVLDARIHGFADAMIHISASPRPEQRLSTDTPEVCRQPEQPL